MRIIIIEETWEQLYAKTNALSEFIKKSEKTLIMMIFGVKPPIYISVRSLSGICVPTMNSNTSKSMVNISIQ